MELKNKNGKRKRHPLTHPSKASGSLLHQKDARTINSNIHQQHSTPQRDRNQHKEKLERDSSREREIVWRQMKMKGLSKTRPIRYQLSKLRLRHPLHTPTCFKFFYLYFCGSHNKHRVGDSLGVGVLVHGAMAGKVMNGLFFCVLICCSQPLVCFVNTLC